MKLTAISTGLCLAVSAQIAHAFDLTSADMKHGQRLSEQQIANGFGCSGVNLSPQLIWRNPPKGTKSYAVTVYDPDAPTGSGWWHWIAFDIPAHLTGLEAGIGPDAPIRQWENDYGYVGYGGPCPPPPRSPPNPPRPPPGRSSPRCRGGRAAA